MNRATLASSALLAVALLAGPSAQAQVDLAKALVGTWEGQVQTLGVGNREDPNRTLIIRSVTQNEGKWVAQGRFGITGKGLGPVQVEVDASGKKPWIRFVTAADATIRLELLQEGHLAGTFSRREVGGTLGNDRAIKLEKKE